MSLPSLSPLLLLMATALVSCMFVVVVAGHFPVQSRAEKFTTLSGLLVLWGSICVVVISSLGTVYFSAMALPLYATIIGGGLMVLAAPLAVQPFSNHIVDSKQVLLALAAVSLALCIAAYRFI